MGQLVMGVAGAVVGAVIGFFATDGAGTVQGAEIGFALGSAAGSLLIHKTGPAPNDLRVQDSAYGRPIPWLYGIYRGAGNVIWCGEPSATSSGKGAPSAGGGAVTLSFAVGVCAGPILGIRRIWANGKLIYDVSNPSNFSQISGSNQMITGFKVYLGDEAQDADPTIQAVEGVDNTPPFRGLAYVVFNSLDLSPWGNYMPSLSFEAIVSGETVYTKTGASAFNPGGLPFGSSPTAIGTQIDAAGNVSGFTYGVVGSFFGIASFVQSQGGVTTFPQLPNAAVYIPTGFGSPFQFCQSYDEGGILVSDGNWYDLNGFATNYGAPFALSVPGGNGSAIKKNNRVYATQFVASTAYPMMVSSGGLEGWQLGDTAIAMRLVGVTGAHIYVVGVDPSDATYFNKLIQFDINGNHPAILTTDSHFDSGTCGYCVSDTEIYFAGGFTTIHMWNGSALVDTGIPGNIGGLSTFTVQNGNAYFSAYGGGGGNEFYAEVPTFQYLPEPLANIVADMCNRAGLSPSQYDVTSLTDTVTGYAVGTHASPRGNLTPLMATYFFDANDTGDTLKFIKRGSAPVGTFHYADLGSSASLGDDANMVPITEPIQQEVDMPRSLLFTYNALNADYQVNSQRAFKANTKSNKDVAMQAPIVLSDDEGLMRAQTMLWGSWVGRRQFQVSTGLGYIQYEPGDVVFLENADGDLYTARITKCTYDGQGNLQWEMTQEEPDIYPNSTYNAQGGAPKGIKQQALDYASLTILRVIDVPPLRNIDGQTPSLYLAACGLSDNWPGVMVDVSRDGSSYTQWQRILNASAIGFTNGALPSFGGGNQPDELSTVSVTLYSGSLSSVSYSDFMGGLNAALIGNEIVFFRTATQTAANVYTLSGFVRARGGTDWAAASHQSGEQFVFLDASKLINVTVNQSDIGEALYLEPHLLNMFLNQPVSPVVDTVTDATVRPLAPTLFKAGRGSAGATTDISLNWFRQARLNAAWLNGTDVPLDESTESYQLAISNASGVVKRTVVVTAATTYTYLAADITTDGFTTGNTINFSVAQNSNQGVLGHAATTSFVR